MSDFSDFWLETVRIQANAQQMFPLEDTVNPCNTSYRNQFELDMAAYERDRDKAEQITEPCHRCHRLAVLYMCEFCKMEYCIDCLGPHECSAEILWGGKL